MGYQGIIGTNLKFSSEFEEGFYHLEEDFNIPAFPIEGDDLFFSKETDQLKAVPTTGIFVFHFGPKQSELKVVSQ